MKYPVTYTAPDSLAENFCQLGTAMQEVSSALESGNPGTLDTVGKLELYDAAMQSVTCNPWFTNNNVALALKNLGLMLNETDIVQWLQAYSKALKVKTTTSEKVAAKSVLVIMAGNIPLAGMHDMLCVLAAGLHFQGKLSSQDNMLPGAAAKLLIEIEPAFEKKIFLTEGVARPFDAVIATGSSNSSRYFESYFGKYPHIIRKGRTSVSIITGNESRAELESLGADVFSYYGLGCRNISMIWIPVSFDVQNLTSAWESYNHVLHNHKYANNYLYNKAIFQVNKTPHTDLGFSLLTEDPHLFSPVSVIRYQRYEDVETPLAYIRYNHEKIQCVTGSSRLVGNHNGITPLGQAQQPTISDYADGIDTMEFLLRL